MHQPRIVIVHSLVLGRVFGRALDLALGLGFGLGIVLGLVLLVVVFLVALLFLVFFCLVVDSALNAQWRRERRSPFFPGGSRPRTPAHADGTGGQTVGTQLVLVCACVISRNLVWVATGLRRSFLY